MKMKKAFRTIALLVCMLAIISAPANAYAYTLPVCVVHQPNIVAYQYQPDPLVVQPGNQESLFNYVDELGGSYAVPANKTPHFIVSCNSSASYLVEIYMTSPSYTLMYTNVVTGGGTYITIPANTYDRNFVMRVTPVGGVAINVSSYNYMYD